MNIWTLVANETQARLFASADPHGELTGVRDFAGSESQSAERFTSELVDFLSFSQQEHRFDSLAIAAPAGLLDDLLSQAGDDLSRCILRTVAEDLTNETPQEIGRRVHSVLWIVVADRTRARIMAHEPMQSGQLTEVDDLVWPASHLKASEAQSDRAGRFSSMGGQRELLEPHTDYRHKTAEDFAACIVDYLEHARTTHGIRRLMLVAPPLFLGDLRKKLTSQLRDMVERAIDKEWTTLPLSDIAVRLFGNSGQPVEL